MNAGASMLDLSGVDGGGWVEGMMSDDVSEAAVSLPVQHIQKITPWFWDSASRRDVMLLKAAVAERWNQSDKIKTAQQIARQLTDAGTEFTHHIGPRGDTLTEGGPATIRKV